MILYERTVWTQTPGEGLGKTMTAEEKGLEQILALRPSDAISPVDMLSLECQPPAHFSSFSDPVWYSPQKPLQVQPKGLTEQPSHQWDR